MNALIVDDQYQVVEGMKRGIDWKAMGFVHVFSALNGYGAKQILLENAVDIMLCDIEMPMENGLELIKWVKKNNLPVQCIVLTAHADFDYARLAVKLGCFDYILQPASYQAIEECIKRALNQIQVMENKEDLQRLGAVFKKNEKQMARNLTRNLLSGMYGRQQHNILSERERMPKPKQKVYFSVLQILRWKAQDPWEPDLLIDTIENIANELFLTYDCQCIAEGTEYPYILMVMWSKGQLPDSEIIFCQLQFFNSILQQFLRCELAIYLEGPVLMNEMGHRWKHLKILCEENVSSASGVFIANRKREKKYEYHLPEVKRWIQLLRDGYAKTMEEEACNFLDRLAESGFINKKVLREFYQDFLQVVYHVTETEDGFVRNLFHTQEEFQIYMDGMRSVDQMKALIRYVAAYFDNGEHHNSVSDIIEKVTCYIHGHLDSEMRRDELASVAHLHPDYLTKLFKKEVGMTVKEFIIQAKMKEAQMLLQTTNLPIGIVGAKVGYGNFSHFSHTYKKVMGLTPQEERQNV